MVGPGQKAGHAARFWTGTDRAADGKTRLTFVWEPVVAAGARVSDVPSRVMVTAITEDGRSVFRGRVPDPSAAPVPDLAPGPGQAGASTSAPGAGAPAGASVSFSAPPGPVVVIAGAGAGKSETMAARLVWLVACGLVRPERVLGLTFTRKAAAEFAERVRSRLERLRRVGLEPVTRGGSLDASDAFSGEPVIGTYHSYAGRLVSDHALREGLEPSMRLITPAL